jgi:DNA-binding transcriptional ArsR family regulator
MAFPISRAAISKHIQQLRRADLVKEVRRGRNRFYWLNVQPLDKIERWLESYHSLGLPKSRLPKPVATKTASKEKLG